MSTSHIDLITIDQGNTNPHVGVFVGNDLTKTVALSDFDSNLFKDHHVVLSSVGKKSNLPTLPKLVDIETLWNDHLFAGMNVNYDKEKLGRDRLYQLAFLYHEKVIPNKTPLLLIDAGTFITVDILDTHGYQGGIILPGLSSLASLYPQGEQLPLVDASEFLDFKETHHDTISAITGGVQKMILGAIRSLSLDNQTLYLTGGLSIFIEKWLELHPSLGDFEKDPHLIHKSLNYLGRLCLDKCEGELQ
ncbi:MAG: type III pantothenate kinase [Oligoflexia bacterium]|nr:type III pantothenate kinase [Oligoflexia bacterium]